MSYTPRSLLLGLGLALASASGASAHAPPEVLQVVSTTRDDVIVSTNRGLIFGDRDTQTWSLLCNEAFGVTTSTQYRTVMLPSSGRLLVAESGGLRISDDHGCTWRSHPELGELYTPALAQSRRKPERIYVSVYAMDAAGTRPGEGGIRASDDGGDSLRTLYAASDLEFIGSLLVAETEPAHLYASVSVLGEASFSYVLLHSDDGGTTWTRSPIVASEKEVDITLLAVNPREPLELLARATATEPSQGERLLWSRDGGRTFSSPGTFKSIRSAAFSSDGAAAYVTYLDGLLRASTPERRFERVGLATRLSSVVALDDALLVGGYYAGAQSTSDGLGAAPPSDPEARFAPWMSFIDVRSPTRCALPSRVEEDCARLWLDWTRELGLDRPADLVDAGGAPADASAGPAASGDAGAPHPYVPHADSDQPTGCTLPPRQTGAWGWLPLVCVLALRPRRRVPPHRAHDAADPLLAERPSRGVHR